MATYTFEDDSEEQQLQESLEVQRELGAGYRDKREADRLAEIAAEKAAAQAAAEAAAQAQANRNINKATGFQTQAEQLADYVPWQDAYQQAQDQYQQAQDQYAALVAEAAEKAAAYVHQQAEIQKGTLVPGTLKTWEDDVGAEYDPHLFKEEQVLYRATGDRDEYRYIDPDIDSMTEEEEAQYIQAGTDFRYPLTTSDVLTEMEFDPQSPSAQTYGPGLVASPEYQDMMSTWLDWVETAPERARAAAEDFSINKWGASNVSDYYEAIDAAESIEQRDYIPESTTPGEFDAFTRSEYFVGNPLADDPYGLYVDEYGDNPYTDTWIHKPAMEIKQADIYAYGKQLGIAHDLSDADLGDIRAQNLGMDEITDAERELALSTKGRYEDHPGSAWEPIAHYSPKSLDHQYAEVLGELDAIMSEQAEHKQSDKEWVESLFLPLGGLPKTTATLIAAKHSWRPLLNTPWELDVLQMQGLLPNTTIAGVQSDSGYLSTDGNFYESGQYTDKYGDRREYGDYAESIFGDGKEWVPQGLEEKIPYSDWGMSMQGKILDSAEWLERRNWPGGDPIYTEGTFTDDVVGSGIDFGGLIDSIFREVKLDVNELQTQREYGSGFKTSATASSIDRLEEFDEIRDYNKHRVRDRHHIPLVEAAIEDYRESLEADPLAHYAGLGVQLGFLAGATYLTRGKINPAPIYISARAAQQTVKQSAKYGSGTAGQKLAKEAARKRAGLKSKGTDPIRHYDHSDFSPLSSSIVWLVQPGEELLSLALKEIFPKTIAKVGGKADWEEIVFHTARKVKRSILPVKEVDVDYMVFDQYMPYGRASLFTGKKKGVRDFDPSFEYLGEDIYLFSKPYKIDLELFEQDLSSLRGGQKKGKYYMGKLEVRAEAEAWDEIAKDMKDLYNDKVFNVKESLFGRSLAEDEFELRSTRHQHDLMEQTSAEAADLARIEFFFRPDTEYGYTESDWERDLKEREDEFGTKRGRDTFSIEHEVDYDYDYDIDFDIDQELEAAWDTEFEPDRRNVYASEIERERQYEREREREPETETEPETEFETEPEFEFETEPETEFEWEPEIEFEWEPELEQEPDLEIEWDPSDPDPDSMTLGAGGRRRKRKGGYSIAEIYNPVVRDIDKAIDDMLKDI